MLAAWMLLIAGVANAFEPSRLVGAWTLDLEASEPVLPLLEAAGVGWAERQAMARLPITQVFTLTDTELRVLIDTPIGDRTERLPLAGESKSGTTKEGQPWESATVFEPEAFVTTMRVTLAEGVRTFVIHRSLAEGDRTLFQRLTLTTPDGRTLTARRTFRRAP
jgi:hypothetical protein